MQILKKQNGGSNFARKDLKNDTIWMKFIKCVFRVADFKFDVQVFQKQNSGCNIVTIIVVIYVIMWPAFSDLGTLWDGKRYAKINEIFVSFQKRMLSAPCYWRKQNFAKIAENTFL